MPPRMSSTRPGAGLPHCQTFVGCITPKCKQFPVSPWTISRDDSVTVHPLVPSQQHFPGSSRAAEQQWAQGPLVLISN